MRVDIIVICGFTSVLLGGLWMRSFTCSEEFVCRAPIIKPFSIWSGVGRIVLTLHSQPVGGVGIDYLGPWDQGDRWHATQQRTDRAIRTTLGFGAGRISNGQFRLMIPYWFPVLFAVSLAAACLISSLILRLRTTQDTPTSNH